MTNTKSFDLSTGTRVCIENLTCDKCANKATCENLCGDMQIELDKGVNKRTDYVEITYRDPILEKKAFIHESKVDPVQLKRDYRYITPNLRIKLAEILARPDILTDRQKECLILYYFDELSMTDIAKRISNKSKYPRRANVTYQTVSIHIRRTMNKVRDYLIKENIPNNLHERKCHNPKCGKHFMTAVHNKVFCSEDCRQSTNKKKYIQRRRKDGDKVLCLNPDCDVWFAPKPNQKYHSVKCRMGYYRDKYGWDCPRTNVDPYELFMRSREKKKKK